MNVSASIDEENEKKDHQGPVERAKKRKDSDADEADRQPVEDVKLNIYRTQNETNPTTLVISARWVPLGGVFVV